MSKRKIKGRGREKEKEKKRRRKKKRKEKTFLLVQPPPLGYLKQQLLVLRRDTIQKNHKMQNEKKTNR